MNTKQKQSKSALMIGALLIALALVAGVILFVFVKNARQTTPAVVAVANLKAGDMIKEEDVTVVQVGSYGQPQTLAIAPEQVVGSYMTRDISTGEMFFTSSVTNDYYKRLSEKAKYGAIAIPINNLDAVTGDIKENDFVTVLVSMRKTDKTQAVAQNSNALPDTNTALIYTKELAAIRVLGLYDGSGKQLEKTEEGISPSMLVVDALPIQRVLLNQARDNGTIRLVIPPEYIQQAYRKSWGLVEENKYDEVEENLQKGFEDEEEIEKRHMELSDQENLDDLIRETNRVGDGEVIEGTKEDIIDVDGEGKTDIESIKDNNESDEKTEEESTDPIEEE